MDKKELEKRTKKFALEVIRFVADLPKNKISDVLGYQFLKCGTSIGANYREANRAQSRQDFIHKIAIVEKEASETQYWLELFDASNIGDPESLSWLLQESAELLAIFTSIGKTAKSNQKRKRSTKLR
jgi:four helix bundle protein